MHETCHGPQHQLQELMFWEWPFNIDLYLIYYSDYNVKCFCCHSEKEKKESLYRFQLCKWLNDNFPYWNHKQVMEKMKIGSD